jgi:hypothetical protein
VNNILHVNTKGFWRWCILNIFLIFIRINCDRISEGLLNYDNDRGSDHVPDEERVLHPTFMSTNKFPQRARRYNSAERYSFDMIHVRWYRLPARLQVPVTKHHVSCPWSADPQERPLMAASAFLSICVRSNIGQHIVAVTLCSNLSRDTAFSRVRLSLIFLRKGWSLSPRRGKIFLLFKSSEPTPPHIRCVPGAGGSAWGTKLTTQPQR